MKLIERKSYLQKLIDVEGTPDIKVAVSYTHLPFLFSIAAFMAAPKRS